MGDNGARTRQIGLKAFTHYEVICDESVKRHYVMAFVAGSVTPFKPLFSKILYDTTAE